MFVTELVRNIAWSLRRSRRQLPNAESVLPADAASPVAPTRGERRRNAAQESLEDRVRQPADRPASEAPEVETPGNAGGQPHIDIKV
ncbi:MAG TPA: hypothetical protein VIS73_02635 [Rhodocyclaceae bacterium]